MNTSYIGTREKPFPLALTGHGATGRYVTFATIVAELK
jgi:hypothetical protein